MFRHVLLIVLSASFTAEMVAAKDEKPQLISRTGGGGAATTWSSTAELQKDAAAGKPAALAALGEMLLTGDQVPKDVPRGISLLERAAQAGQTGAAFRLGKIYDDGDLAQRDIPRAIDYYRQAALAGVAEAQYNLGSLYVSARGVKRDYKEGLAWLIVATKHGAEAEGEKQVRDHLKTGTRAQIIPAAEARAAEIELQLGNAPPPPPAASQPGK